MIGIKRLNKVLQMYDAGNREKWVQDLLFRAVEQTRACGTDDIEELENIDEAVRYLKVRLLHDHYRS